MTQPAQPIPDVIGAMRTFLIADAGVNALVGTRVYGGELPREETNQMPRSCVVLRLAGGPANRGTLTVDDVRVDVRCYGATMVESVRLYRTVYTALRYFLHRKAIGDTLIHCVTPESGPITLREPNAEWPFQLSSWRAKLALEVVT